MSVRKIHLHGALGKKYGRVVELDVDTVGDAVRGLSVNFKGFLEDLKEGCWRIVRGDKKTGLELELEDVNSFKLGAADLHFFPVVAGSKRSGAIKTVVGVALVGTAVALAGPGAIFSTPLLGGLISTGNVAMVGLSLSIAGVATLLSPKEQQKTNQIDQRSSQLGPSNVYEQGNPVPLVYGEVICGSVVVSSGLQIDPVPA
jgi:predicted phage tail protein